MKLIIKLCLLFILCLTGISSAQTYPSKTVTIVVPFAPGGVTDVVARLYARKLSTLTGGNFNVENKAGAGGTIGTDFVARAPKDGYVLGMMIDSHTITPALMAKLSYDPIKDFSPIGMMALGQHVIVAHPSFAPSTIKELIDYAKAKPGEPYASSGTGTAQHLGMEMLKLKTGIDLTHVPYKGGGQAINDVVSGQVKVAILGIAPALPFIKSGQLKVLAVTGDSRLALFPQASTVKETVPDFVTLQWFSMMAPAGIPKEVQARLHDLLARVSQDPEIRQRLTAVGLDVQLSAQPADLIRFMELDLAKWPPIVKAAGIKPE